MKRPGLLFLLITGLLLTLLTILSNSDSAKAAPTAGTTPKWSYALPSTYCDPAHTNKDCHAASPLTADIDGDGFADTIVATNNGHVVVVKHNGQLLWDKDIAPAFGLPANGQRIHASPAVADIDTDGFLELVVATGEFGTGACHPGGTIVLEHDGRVKTNWPRLSVDEHIVPENCPDPIYAAPALGDLDQDGDLEIVTGGFDRRINAWHHDAKIVAGFPADSAHKERMEPFNWEVVHGQVLDTIWSSPALADVNGDGYLEIIVGTDEGNFDSSWPGDADGWECPYQPPRGSGYCGGSLYVVDRFGEMLPGFPKRILETIQSTPLVSDIDNDGTAEIFVGTGSYYYINSPDKPTYGFRMYAWDSQGVPLPGWEGGLAVGSVVPSSPALGDITGDGEPEIVVGAMDKKVYAWSLDGKRVAGFPMMPEDHFGNAYANNVGSGPILADYDGDGKMEIFITQGWSVVVIDDNGQVITSTDYPDDKPFYYASGTLMNSPVVADLDNDGDLELIASNSRLYVWDLPKVAKSASWPMFKHDAARIGATPKPALLTYPDSYYLISEVGKRTVTERPLVLARSVLGNFAWEMSSNNMVNASTPAGSANSRIDMTVTIETPSYSMPGEYRMTIVEVTGTSHDNPLLLSPQSIPVHVLVFEDMYQAFLPSVTQ